MQFSEQRKRRKITTLLCSLLSFERGCLEHLNALKVFPEAEIVNTC